MEKVKLGELTVDRRAWVRDKISLDQVRCLTNDLVNGAEFPPLKIDRQTKIIVGGNHRYQAYKNFFGEGWEEQEVGVEFLDLPPIDEDPIAWKMSALTDNRHLAERLRYGDRNNVAADLLKTLGDPDSREAQEIAKLLHFTPQGWSEFSDIVLRSFEEERQPAEKQSKNNAPTDSPAKKASGAKYSTDDIHPVDVRNMTISFNSRVLSSASKLINILKNADPDFLSDQSREVLSELKDVLGMVLESKAV